MKKQVFLRSLLGAFVGCFIGVVIIICISLAIGGGDMHVATLHCWRRSAAKSAHSACKWQPPCSLALSGRARPSFGKWSGGASLPADADASSPVQRRSPADCVGNGLDGRSARLVSLRLRRDVRRHLAD